MRRSALLAAMMLLAFLAASTALRAADDAPIDMNKARQLYQREQRGDKLTPDEQAYLDRAKALRNQQTQQNQPGGANMPPPRESTGLVPLTDLLEKYKDQDGGLYGGGKNQPPAQHLKLAQNAAADIRPRDAAGKPAADGKIVLLSIGMSNTTQEFSRFKTLADADPVKNPSLLIVDAAQGGMDAAAWLDQPKADRVWQRADQILNAAGGTLEQVQALWIKQALIQPARLGEFPKHSAVLQDDLVKIIGHAMEHYPNLRLAYLSSRIYAGYASTPLNPEPYAYESAFSVRGVIEQQLKGDPALNADAGKGAVKAPVLLWGPYLWADGTKGRKIDKLLWTRADLGPDGTHPSTAGRDKVAGLLLDFFKTDPTAKAWFSKAPAH